MNLKLRSHKVTSGTVMNDSVTFRSSACQTSFHYMQIHMLELLELRYFVYYSIKEICLRFDCPRFTYV